MSFISLLNTSGSFAMTLDTLVVTPSTSENKTSNGTYTLYLPFVAKPPPPIYLPFVAQGATPTLTPTPTRTSTPIPNPIKNGGFEEPNDGNTGPWWASLTYIGQPVQGVDVRDTLAGTGATPRTGSYASWLGGFPYGKSGYQVDLLQQITVPTGGSTLRYWIWIQSEESLCDRDNLDGTWVFFLTSQQNLLESYALCTANHTNGWVKREVSLANYVGQTGWLAFSTRILGANSNLFIDDVALGTLTNVPQNERTPTPTRP